MPQLLRSTEFDRWLGSLRDERARSRIQIRLLRLAGGNPGDVKPVGGGISELRVDYGPGYRVYIGQRGSDVILLLYGGTKRTQADDITKARGILHTLRS